MKQAIKMIIICSLIFCLLISGLYAADKWLIKITDTNNKVRVIKSREFINDYSTYLGLQSTFSNISDKMIKRLIKNKRKQQEYLKSYLSYELIVQYCKQRNLVNMRRVSLKARKMASIIKRMLIVKQFIKKMVVPKIKKVTKYDINKFYNQNKRNPRFKKRVRGLSASRIKELIRYTIRNRRRMTLVQKYITRLKERNKIKINKKYFKNVSAN